MTQTRFRSRPRRAQTSARTARLVWINAELGKALTSTGIVITDLLGNAGPLKHDATIVAVRFDYNSTSIHIPATTINVEHLSALWVGAETSTIATVPDPNTDTENASYLWRHTAFAQLRGDAAGTAAGTSGTFRLHFPVHVRAKRRFREDFNTLWYILNVVSLSTIGSINMKVHTLLRVP